MIKKILIGINYIYLSKNLLFQKIFFLKIQLIKKSVISIFL